MTEEMEMNVELLKVVKESPVGTEHHFPPTLDNKQGASFTRRRASLVWATRALVTAMSAILSSHVWTKATQQPEHRARRRCRLTVGCGLLLHSDAWRCCVWRCEGREQAFRKGGGGDQRRAVPAQHPARRRMVVKRRIPANCARRGDCLYKRRSDQRKGGTAGTLASAILSHFS